MSLTALYPAGTAPVKAEFLLSALEDLRPQVDDASAEEGTNHAAQKRRQEDGTKDDGTPKKQKLSGSERRKLAKEEKKAQRGSNKGRRWAKVRDEVDLCWRFASSGKCDFGSECVLLRPLLDLCHHLADSPISRCRLSHDIPAYLEAKPRDIFFPPETMLSNEPPFVSLPSTAKGNDASEQPSVDFPIRCPVFEATGSCRIGVKCRFLGGHARKAEDGTASLVEDEGKKEVTLTANTELNFVSPTTLKLLRTKKVGIYPPYVPEVCNKTTQFPTPVSDGYLQELKAMAGDLDSKEDDHGVSIGIEGVASGTTPNADGTPSIEEPSNSEPLRHHPVSSASSSVVPLPAPTKWSSDEAAAQADLPDVPFRFSEKKRLHWSDKTCT